MRQGTHRWSLRHLWKVGWSRGWRRGSTSYITASLCGSVLWARLTFLHFLQASVSLPGGRKVFWFWDCLLVYAHEKDIPRACGVESLRASGNQARAETVQAPEIVSVPPSTALSISLSACFRWLWVYKPRIYTLDLTGGVFCPFSCDYFYIRSFSKLFKTESHLVTQLISCHLYWKGEKNQVTWSQDGLWAPRTYFFLP